MEDSYTNTVLKAIGRALNEGVNDIRVMTITITALVIIIIVLSTALRMRNKKKIIVSSEVSYQKLIRKFNLTILEMDMIEKLSGSLKKPADKYLLLVNKSRFRQAVNKTELISEDDDELIKELKIKLGFVSSDKDIDMISTISLTSGMPVKLGNDRGEFVSAEIYSISESNLTVKYPNQTTPIIPDKEIKLFTCTSEGFRLFNLKPDKIRNELFSAPHTEAEKIEKLNTNIDITIETMTSDKIEEKKSIIVRLSNNGALIIDKKNELLEGDKIGLLLNNDRKKLYRLNAEVVKISLEKGLASVKFTELNK